MSAKSLHVATVALLVGGALGAGATFSSPAAAISDAPRAKVVATANFAKNADRVDGLHAVKSSTPAAKRKGKLVATNSAGRLPDTIIKKAPDANRLDGVDGAAYRYIPLDLAAALPTGETTTTYHVGAFGSGGLSVPDGPGNRIGWGLVLPPSFPTGATLTIRLLWHVNEAGCTVNIQPNAASHDRAGLVVAAGSASAGLEGPGSVTAPAVANTTVSTVFTAAPTREGTQFKALDSYIFSLFRSSDSCTAPVIITGASVTF